LLPQNGDDIVGHYASSCVYLLKTDHECHE